MDRSCTHRLRLRRLPGWLAAGLSAGAPLLGLGCISSHSAVDVPPAIQSYPLPQAAAQVRQASYQAPAESPKTDPPADRSDNPAPPANDPRLLSQAPVPAAPVMPQKLPITLDAVFRLAEKHNPRIGLARERLYESHLSQSGQSACIPDIYVGMAYYRHEGGIQDFSGQLLHSSTQAFYPNLSLQTEINVSDAIFRQIDSQRKVWQQKAELSQVNNEVLLDAAQTYIDLLTARQGEALSAEVERYEKKLLERAQKLAKADPAAEALAESVRAALSNRLRLMAELRQRGNAASAKLVYLLGLPPDTCLLPAEMLFGPVELVDSAPPVCDLVNLALTQGPGVHEMEGLLATAEQAVAATYDVRNFLPQVQLNVCEGLFGAGPGGSMAFDNRLDVGVQLRWNVSKLFQAEQQRSILRSKHKQAALNYQELKGRLAATVQEARDAILHGREQIGLAAEQIRHASESYRLNDRRVREGVPNATDNDVLLSIRNLELSLFNHLQALSGHNKAQIRLVLVLGPQPKKAPPPHLPVPVVTPDRLPAPQEKGNGKQ